MIPTNAQLLFAAQLLLYNNWRSVSFEISTLNLFYFYHKVSVPSLIKSIICQSLKMKILINQKLEKIGQTWAQDNPHIFLSDFFGPPQWKLEQFYEIRFVRPYVHPPLCLSRRFFGIVSLVFSKSWHGVRSLHEVVRDRLRFFGKIFFAHGR